MNLSEIKLRLAADDEAKLLSDLAGRSKSYWPYDEDYLKVCRSVTHVTAQDIQRWPFTVAACDRVIYGFSAPCEVNGENMLDHLWIEPCMIGRGLGRRLFSEAVRHAKALRWPSFTIASDPYAEHFYLKMGARRIGERESKIKKGFFLPLLEYRF